MWTGRPARPSQRNRLREDSLAEIGRQAALGEDIHVDSQGVLNLLRKSDQIEEASIFGHFDQKVQIVGASESSAALELGHEMVNGTKSVGRSPYHVVSDFRPKISEAGGYVTLLGT